MKFLRQENYAWAMKEETGSTPILPNATRWAGYCQQFQFDECRKYQMLRVVKKNFKYIQEAIEEAIQNKVKMNKLVCPFSPQEYRTIEDLVKILKRFDSARLQMEQPNFPVLSLIPAIVHELLTFVSCCSVCS
jgi:hypothetical protein